MDAPLGLCLRDALHAVRPALELEHRVGTVALDLKGVLAVAALHQLRAPAAALGVLGQHPVHIPRPQAGLLATGPALDLDDHALGVVGVALDHRQADLLGELLAAAPGGAQLLAQLGVLTLLRQHLFGAEDGVVGLAPLARELGGGLELAVGPPGLGIASAIGDHLRVGDPLAELAEASFDLLHQFLDHLEESMARCAPSMGANASQATSSRPTSSSAETSPGASRASTA